MNPLTSSEMKAWQTCQRGWWIAYYRRLRRARELPSLMNVGSLVHLGLEKFYAGEELRPAELIRARADKLISEYPELAEQIGKDAQLAAIMLDGYVEWVDTEGVDVGLEYVGSEQDVEAQVGPYVLRGKIDARLRRTVDGALLQLEHKTVGNFTDLPKYAQGAPQFLNYDLLAFLTKPDGVPTDGVILNMLRRVKRTGTAKPPFYARHEVRHNTDELRSHYKHVVGVGVQIEEARRRLDAGEEPHLVCPPSISRSHTWSCDCTPLGSMFDDGSDVEGYLAEFYEAHDPWERYNETKEEE